MATPYVGVLALQGCVEPHCTMLERLGCKVKRVRFPQDLASVDRIIFPGGESSTMLSLIEGFKLFEALRSFAHAKPAWGVCAGAILLAQEVVHPSQRSLESLPVRAHRNFYGSQLESFSATVESPLFTPPLGVDFIRAPRLEPLDSQVKILATYRGEAVLLQHGRILVSAFHTELQTDVRLHQYFLEL